MMFSLQSWDENSNGILDGQEIVNFKEDTMFDNTVIKAELAQSYLKIIFAQQ